ncbi:Stomatin-like protein 3, partial [Eschrichtius robustus]|nr:Stomatin-like protein 3 [Eschrichtius robustus]
MISSSACVENVKSIGGSVGIIKEYERAVVFRLGRIQADKAKGPGLILVLPCIDVFVKVDLRTVTCNIPPQETLLDDATKLWGIQVAQVEIKDVRIPGQLQRSMAAEAEATREARARVLAAEGEMNASEALKSASKVLAESPIALQLRYLQTLTTVATEKNSTIVFPLPTNVLEGMGGISYNNHKKVPNRT